jgi:hypothetical protein
LGSTSIFRWDQFPNQKADLINYIVEQNITGVLFISGHLQLGLLTHLAQNDTIGGLMVEVRSHPFIL